jgi:hypothetical protein
MNCSSLKLIIPSAIEPVTLEEVKLHAHIDHSVQDTILASWIKSARELAEGFQRRAYIGQVWEMSFDDFPPLPLELPRAPLMGVMSIKYYDYLNAETTLYEIADNPITTTEEPGTDSTGNSNFLIDTASEPGRIDHAYLCVWPSPVLRPMDAVKIRYAAGYGLKATDVPENVREAIMVYCTFKNENRASEVDNTPKQFFDLLRHDRLYI